MKSGAKSAERANSANRRYGETPLQRSVRKRRTGWQYVLFVGFILILVLSFGGVIAYHVFNPSILTTAVAADVMVGLGTAALAVAAARQLWAWTENRIEDRWPHLRVLMVEDTPGGLGPPHGGGPFKVSDDKLAFIVENVGPGLATDVQYRWIFHAIVAARGKSFSMTKWYDCANFLRPGDRARIQPHGLAKESGPGRGLASADELIFQCRCGDLDRRVGDWLAQGVSREPQGNFWVYQQTVSTQAVLGRAKNELGDILFDYVGDGLPPTPSSEQKGGPDPGG
jgi:hypothetical protein